MKTHKRKISDNLVIFSDNNVILDYIIPYYTLKISKQGLKNKGNILIMLLIFYDDEVLCLFIFIQT